MLQIKATDLTGLHQRLHTDQVRTKKSRRPQVWPSHTCSQEAIVHAQPAARQICPFLTSKLLDEATLRPSDGVLSSRTYYIRTLLLIILGMWDAAQRSLPEEVMNTEETIMEEIKGVD